MSKKANPTAIGLFVILGLTLAVGGLVLFGSAQLFSVQERFVLYFDASVKGLNPGAPVKFRGVTVGSVVEVRIRLNQAEDDLTIPVIIEVDVDLVRQKTDRAIDLKDEEALQAAVEKGLRGLLDSQSILTGLLYVQLEYLANPPEPILHQVEPIYREIPTAPTDIQALMDNLAQVDLKSVTVKLDEVLGKLNTSLSELQMRDINAGVTNLLTTLHRTFDSLELAETMQSAQATLDEVRLLSETLRAKIGPLADDADLAIQNASATFAELNQGVQDLREMLAPQAALRVQLVRALDDLGRAGESVAELAEFLKRNPNALIVGREQPAP